MTYVCAQSTSLALYKISNIAQCCICNIVTKSIQWFWELGRVPMAQVLESHGNFIDNLNMRIMIISISPVLWN